MGGWRAEAMTRRSDAWKDLERATAEALGGKRVTTPWDLFEVRTDVIVPDHPEWAVDAKYRQRWAHHSYLREIARKYGKERPVPLLITKGAKETGAYVTLPLDEFGKLLDKARRAGT